LNEELAAIRRQLDETREALLAAQDEALRTQRGLIDALGDESRRRELNERALTAAREELLAYKDARDSAERALREVRRDLEALRHDGAEYAALVADVDKLKSRSAETIGHLRRELTTSLERLDRVEKRYVQLRQAYSVVSDQFDVATSQLETLEAGCRRLAEEADDCRRRTIVAERALHDYLAGFADRNGSVAAIGERRALVARISDIFPALLSQLNAMSDRMACAGDG